MKSQFTCPVTGLSGKLYEGDNVHFRTIRKTGKSFMVVVEHPNKRPPTAKQIAHRKDFGMKSKVVKQWFEDNKPSDAMPRGTEEYQRMKKAFDRQYKIDSMFGFVFKKLFSNV